MEEYKRTLLKRFSNPTINDQVTRICSEGSAKIPKWLLPSIAELSAEGKRTSLLTLAIASWIFYLAQDKDERGKPMEIVDARSRELIPLAKRSLDDPRVMLSERSIFGDALASDPAFVQAVKLALVSLGKEGASATIRHYLS